MKLILDHKSGKRFFLNSEICVLIDHGQLVFIKDESADFEFEIENNKQYSLPGSNLIFIAEELDASYLSKKFSVNPKIEYIDSDKVTGKLKIRNFKNGDRFCPLNLKGEKKVSDFFTDSKVPLHLRNEIPMLVCASGIVWIIGYRLDDRFKISKNSTKILKLQVNEGKAE